MYDLTGNSLTSFYRSLLDTQEEATDILSSQIRVKELEAKNKILILRYEKLKSKLLEYSSLSKQIDFVTNFSHETIAAKIIGRSPDTWHKQIIINKGTQDGINTGKGVLTEKGIIGQVTRATKNNAIVHLIFDNNFKIGVKNQRTNQYCILNGNYPAPSYLSLITVDSDVQEGDQILSSGIALSEDNYTYPENYPIGEVIEVRKDPEIVDLMVKVKLNEDLSKIREVFVLK